MLGNMADIFVFSTRKNKENLLYSRSLIFLPLTFVFLSLISPKDAKTKKPGVALLGDPKPNAGSHNWLAKEGFIYSVGQLRHPHYCFQILGLHFG